MREDWDFYFCRVDERPASVVVDLAAHETAREEKLEHLGCVQIHLETPRADDGLVTSHEAALLAPIEDALIERIEAECGARIVGRVTCEGKREIYFYMKTTVGFDESVAGLTDENPNRKFSSSSEHDPGWKCYWQLLYPGPAEIRWMKDRRMVEQLLEHGDSIEIPRMVDHFIDFKSQESQRAFLEESTPQGFLGETLPQRADGEGVLNFGVVLRREDPVELWYIHGVVLRLLDMAERHDGRYDRWGCSVQCT